MFNQLLSKIRTINKHKLKAGPVPDFSDIYNMPQIELADLFRQELEKVGGKVFLCESEKDFIEKISFLFSEKQWKKPVTFSPFIKDLMKKANLQFYDSEEDFLNLDVGLVECEALAAWTGSVLVSSALPGGRRINVYSPELVVLARYEQLFPDIQDALEYVIKKYPTPPSQISAITGPSKTADIEKTLIYGMHGAREVYVFLW